MPVDIINMTEYCLFTFATTSYALKAEKELKTAQAIFVVVPTLREISSSCGLSVKLPCENREDYLNILNTKGVKVDRIYDVKKVGKKNQVTVLESWL
ncbi:DUF3343 domain-containing protein [Syntrophomonas palmitatica]|uniref:DUF3343 domain-containing protein n=1 Tax=Syntrophomonas palmitatica TaxID=402877 RepID=UPI0006D0862D|nr:DUF3343 domain-containing protein [Syntrophomonas palmitatica]